MSDQEKLKNKRAGKPIHIKFGLSMRRLNGTLDPLSKYHELSYGDIVESLGILPAWLAEGTAEGSR